MISLLILGVVQIISTSIGKIVPVLQVVLQILVWAMQYLLTLGMMAVPIIL
nr:MAG: hypothetical protein [Bacteriophage sp.]UVN08463.1 MAG: hypothetical protein [Bacteriophage sp.]